MFGGDGVCMAESNFPVEKMSVGYGVLWNVGHQDELGSLGLVYRVGGYRAEGVQRLV